MSEQVVGHGASRARSDAELSDLAKRCLAAVHANMPKYDEATRADERRRIREGAVERVKAVLSDTSWLREYQEPGGPSWFDDYVARIVGAVIGKE